MKSFIPLLSLFLSAASAHTIVRAVYVNGEDQGSAVGIREPGFNGPPGRGYNNSPVKNLTLIDLRCNILGDAPAADRIEVVPGDVVTFEWGHESRLPTDEIIAGSHHGPGLVYIAEDPPKSENAWIKLWEKGEYEQNKWFVTTELVENRGAHSIQIPDGLKPGNYLLRPELITLHEGETDFRKNPVRGTQIYQTCIQITVKGDGEVALPEGVPIPGVYKHDDPGILYNIYWTEPGAAPYKIPGPTVWSGAATSVPNPPLGTKKGSMWSPPISRWIDAKASIVYSIIGTNQTTSSSYTATWPGWPEYTPPAWTPPPVTATTTTSEPEPTSTEVPTTTEEPSTTVVIPPVTTAIPTTLITSTKTKTTKTKKPKPTKGHDHGKPGKDHDHDHGKPGKGDDHGKPGKDHGGKGGHH